MMLLLVAFLGTGYVTISGVTATPALAGAAATSCGGPCVLMGGLSGAISVVGASVTSAITAASASISASMSTAMASFSALVGEKTALSVENLVGHVQDLWNFNLDPSMKNMASQLSAITADQTRAMGAFVDASNMIRVRQELRNKQIETYRQLTPSTVICGPATVAGGLTRAGSFQRAYNAAAPAEQVGRSGNEVGTPGATGSVAEMNADFQQYASRYCSTADNNGAAGCTADGAFVGQDIDVTGTVFSKETIDLTSTDTKQTVDDLIHRIAEPFVKDPVLPGAVDSSPGQQTLLAGEAYKAKRQVIYDSLYHIVSRRVPGSNMGDFVRPLRIAAGINPAQISTNPSHNEIMQAMMSERFHSGKYAQQQVDTPENNQREMVIQQAFQLMQMSDQLDLMDRYSLLLAAQIGAEVRQSKHMGTAAAGATVK